MLPILRYTCTSFQMWLCVCVCVCARALTWGVPAATAPAHSWEEHPLQSAFCRWRFRSHSLCNLLSLPPHLPPCVPTATLSKLTTWLSTCVIYMYIATCNICLTYYFECKCSHTVYVDVHLHTHFVHTHCTLGDFHFSHFSNQENCGSSCSITVKILTKVYSRSPGRRK